MGRGTPVGGADVGMLDSIGYIQDALGGCVLQHFFVIGIIVHMGSTIQRPIVPQVIMVISRLDVNVEAQLVRGNQPFMPHWEP